MSANKIKKVYELREEWVVYGSEVLSTVFLKQNRNKGALRVSFNSNLNKDP